LKLLVVNRSFKDPHKGFETIKDALSRIDQKEVEVTLVGSNSDWAAKDLKGGIGVRTLDYLHDREALDRLYSESEIFLFASPAENFPCVIFGGAGRWVWLFQPRAASSLHKFLMKKTDFLRLRYPEIR
jgi:glycosyltransferase involved in cell wall biosynthesis